MRCRFHAIFLVALLSPACAPQSSLPEGRDDAVRWQLPRGFAPLLEHPTRLDLLALDDEEAFPERLPGFPNEGVRARFAISDRSDRRWLVRSLYQAVRRGSAIAMCFSPHHAIRTVRGDQELTIAICLSCLQIAYAEGDELRYVAIDPGVLEPALDGLFGEHGMRFDRSREPFGAWVTE